MSALAAQGDNPVRWRTIVKAGADGNGTVTFRSADQSGMASLRTRTARGRPESHKF